MSGSYVIKIQDPTDRTKFITKYKSLEDYDWLAQLESPKGSDIPRLKTGVQRMSCGSIERDGSNGEQAHDKALELANKFYDWHLEALPNIDDADAKYNQIE